MTIMTGTILSIVTTFDLHGIVRTIILATIGAVVSFFGDKELEVFEG